MGDFFHPETDMLVPQTPNLSLIGGRSHIPVRDNCGVCNSSKFDPIT
jgi:hypothetical protein